MTLPCKAEMSCVCTQTLPGPHTAAGGTHGASRGSVREGARAEARAGPSGTHGTRPPRLGPRRCSPDHKRVTKWPSAPR